MPGLSCSSCSSYFSGGAQLSCRSLAAGELVALEHGTGTKRLLLLASPCSSYPSSSSSLVAVSQPAHPTPDFYGALLLLLLLLLLQRRSQNRESFMLLHASGNTVFPFPAPSPHFDLNCFPFLLSLLLLLPNRPGKKEAVFQVVSSHWRHPYVDFGFLSPLFRHQSKTHF